MKSCNFDIQVLVQSSKEDFSCHIEKVMTNSLKMDNQYLKELSEKYVKYIRNFSIENKSSSKSFYIIISNKIEEKEVIINQYEIQKNELQEKFFKIKNFLSRIGNTVEEYNSKVCVVEFLKKCLSNCDMEMERGSNFKF